MLAEPPSISSATGPSAPVANEVTTSVYASSRVRSAEIDDRQSAAVPDPQPAPLLSLQPTTFALGSPGSKSPSTRNRNVSYCPGPAPRLVAACEFVATDDR